MDWFVLFLLVLAAARVTHLLADDVIFETPRTWLETHSPGKLSYLWTCTWCVSMYTGAFAAYLAHRWAGLDGAEVWLSWFAFSYSTVMLESFIEYLTSFGHDH